MEFQLKAPRIPQLSVVEQVFVNRGIPLNEIEHYLNTTEADIIDPSTIPNINEGAKMLVSHIAQNSKTLLIVDSDCDGYTSAAVLMNYLNNLFPSFVQNNIIYKTHEGKAHGIIEEAITSEVKFVIAPDCSSNEFELHQKLHEKGIDILVIDHHNASHVSEHACVINNQLCDYPTKSLSGVGMVYKFCSYLDKLLQVNYAENYLDLVALGIIADVMDLRDYETRQLIKTGLNNIKNPFLQGMVTKQSYSLKGKVTPFGVAFYIAPGVNATTRVGTMEEKMTMFEAMLEFRAYETIPSTKRGCKGQYETRVEQACRNCTNIRNRQNNTRDANLETIERLIKLKKLTEHQILLIQLSNATPAITGLIANQIMGKYQKPTLILNKVETDEGIKWSGSGRNMSNSTFDNFQKFLNDSGLVEFAEGHANAFGVMIKDENISKLIEYSDIKLKDINFTPIYYPDIIYHSTAVIGEEILALADLNHVWGQGVEEPKVAITGVKVNASNINLFNSTLKITLPSSSQGISLVKFRSSEEEYETLYSDLGCVTINVIGTCSRNTGWDDKPQIIIEEYEIVNRADYYF